MINPQITFFSGGSALKDLSKNIIKYTTNSVHLITPFDSGASTGEIRKYFDYISTGDIRSRMLSMVNPDFYNGNYNLFQHRFDKYTNNEILFTELKKIVYENTFKAEENYFIECLKIFIENLSPDFILNNGSIGNFILTGGFLKEKDIYSVLTKTAQLLHVEGIVLPTIDKSLHIGVKLENNQIIYKQHNITGKETQPIKSSISDIFIIDNENKVVQAEINENIKKTIKSSDLICYSIGSFYTSLISNLIINGVSNAIKETKCNKIFILNTFTDIEQFGMTFENIIDKLLFYLNKSNDEISNYLNYVVIDSSYNYPFDLNIDYLKNLNIKVIDTKLISQQSYPKIDSELLIQVMKNILK